MTREKILAEINKLEAEIQKLSEDIDHAYRVDLRESRKADRATRKSVRGGGPLPSACFTGSYETAETYTLRMIDKCKNERAEKQRRKNELKSQLRDQSSVASVDQSPRFTGTIKWFNKDKGFGFISVEGQPDVFLHKSAFKESCEPEEGDKITFKRAQGQKGPKAVDVRYVSI